MTKTDREGKQASYDIFLADISHIVDSAINPTPEIRKTQWLTKEEVSKVLTFPELVELFLQAIQHIPDQGQ